MFDEALSQTAREMLLVMYMAEGVGLAAPQVTINRSFPIARSHAHAHGHT